MSYGGWTVIEAVQVVIGVGTNRLNTAVLLGILNTLMSKTGSRNSTNELNEELTLHDD